jgi:hypothetical protein
MIRPQHWLPAIAVLAIVLVAGSARASDSPERDRLNKQIGSMEKALDHLLLDSPNFLVQRGRNAQGVCVPDYGVIFTFNAALNADDAFIEIFHDHGVPGVVIESGDGSHRHGHRRALRMLGINIDSHRHHDEADDPLKLYREGKTELVEFLLDHAGKLASLPAGQWVVISGYVDDETLQDEEGTSRLLLRVRTDDLKAYADRKLSDEEAAARIQVEES